MRIIMIVLFVSVVASVTVTATVFAIKGEIRFDDDKIVFNQIGRTVELEPDRKEIDPNGLCLDVFVDCYGSEYLFSEDNHFLGMIYSPNSPDLHDWIEKSDESICSFSDEEAIEAATELGHTQFGEAFDGLTFRQVTTDGLGNITVNFWDLLGENGFVIGTCFFATYSNDGTLLSYGLPNYYDLKDFDESLLDGIKNEEIIADIESKSVELYGDRLIKWYLVSDGKVALKKNSSGYFLNATVISIVRSEYDGSERGDGGKVYRYSLPFIPS